MGTAATMHGGNNGAWHANASILSRGILTALLLTFAAFLAYLSVPQTCTDTARYIHATILQDRATSGQTPGNTVGSSSIGSNSSDSTVSSSTISVAAAKQAALPAEVPTAAEELSTFGSPATLLQHLLPLTNFSNLTSVQLLDDAAGKINHDGLWQLMQLHNKLFCSAKMHLKPLNGTVGVSFGNVTMYVYDGHDIVSDHLKGQAHTWEGGEIQEMLWALRQYPYTRQLAASSSAGSSSSSSVVVARQGSTQAGGLQQPAVPLMVDVGANLGWFMLNAAAAGARVAAFEAMTSNIALLRRSLCTNTWLEERIALYGTGLGATPSACYLISGTDNRGDGLAVCAGTQEEALRNASNRPGYEVRDMMAVRRLDTLLAEDVQVLKIDVEGFETEVLKGAEQLLTKHNVWYIMAECNVGLIGVQAGKTFIRFLAGLGYAVSPHSFKGPFFSKAELQGPANCTTNTLYSVKQEAVLPPTSMHPRQLFK
eukprot:GHRR01005155.1.p1 GENE.GHRR01005155.1~~GHRR01005155.1.p1  ORF type:complete len:483 (+),score=198.37 GHRR01005155.1:74-1522(+)